MVTLDPAAGHLTLINIFTVDRARVDELVASLSRSIDGTMRHLPGFVSASLHVSRDGRFVANYAQWRSQADFDAMLGNPEAQVNMRETAAIAQSFDPVTYDLREVHSAG